MFNEDFYSEFSSMAGFSYDDDYSDDMASDDDFDDDLEDDEDSY